MHPPTMASEVSPEGSTTNDAYYRALCARDARFDGCFFTGVTSTGIYCRPVCSVKTPKRENCRFFGLAAQAEKAGFRPCLRCRPELAPHSLVWSFQDASTILAHQAARLIDESDMGNAQALSVQSLADRLGVSDRHLRRMFEAKLGVSPMQYMQTHRLLTAKQLLTDTTLPITQIALASGFASVRRFNAAFVEHYQLNPSQLRKTSTQAQTPVIRIKLAYRPPYDVDALLEFMQKRHLNAIELVANNSIQKHISSTFYIKLGDIEHTGWLTADFDTTRCQVVLQVSDTLRQVLPHVIRRVRAWLDLDADPKAINAVLHDAFPLGDGLRVPGCLNGFELAIRAVLGQQITVAAARTLAQRLVDALGQTVSTPYPELSRCFPTPDVLASVSGDTLGALGIVRQRQAAIMAIAQAVVSKRLQLQGGVDVHTTVATLKDLPGVGDWTAQYIAMRALRWPDAFPAGDGALHKALGVQHVSQPDRAALAASEAWRPWRSYAVIRSWSTL